MIRLKNIVKGKQVNSCGDCTLCCTVLPIHGAGIVPTTAACESCTHLGDNGCSRHSERADVCKNFLCLYALGATQVKPLESGVVWTTKVTPAGDFVRGHCADVDAAAKHPDTQRMLKYAKDAKQFTYLTLQDSKRVDGYNLKDGSTRTNQIKQEGMFNEIIPGSV